MNGIRTFEWNGDFEGCRAEADAGKFDAELAEIIARKMRADYHKRLKGAPIGWSLSASSTFDFLWTYDDRVKHHSEHEAKVLFLASSDIFQKLEFGGRSAQEKRDDLKSRMSRLSEMSAQLELHHQKLTDNLEEADTLEETYQTLFAETLQIYGN